MNLRHDARGASLFFVLLACSLQGCGRGDSAAPFADTASRSSAGTANVSLTTAAPGKIGPAANKAPTISGKPATSVMPGMLYSFQPTAADADGDELTFSIVNRPVWATFDAATGLLQGTPGPGDAGTVAGIVINVSDGAARAALRAFKVSVQSTALGWARLTWDSPATKSKGPTSANLAGFKVYWGTKPGRYSNSATIMNPDVTAYVVENLAPNTYHFRVAAVSKTGAERVYSNLPSKTIP
jgi:hypothetical protein